MVERSRGIRNGDPLDLFEISRENHFKFLACEIRKNILARGKKPPDLRILFRYKFDDEIVTRAGQQSGNGGQGNVGADGEVMDKSETKDHIGPVSCLDQRSSPLLRSKASRRPPLNGTITSSLWMAAVPRTPPNSAP